jgi:hypothetical protein
MSSLLKQAELPERGSALLDAFLKFVEAGIRRAPPHPGPPRTRRPVALQSR